jgi:hypothetical protein
MAIFISNLMLDGALPIQGNSQGLGTTSARVKLPSGTRLTDGDFIRIARIASQVPIHRITVRATDLDGGGSPALVAQLGYERAVRDPSKPYNATSNPYIAGTSAGDDTDYFVTLNAVPLQAGGVATYVAGQSALDNEFANSGVITGTVDLVYEVTTTANGAITSDGFIDVLIEYSGLPITPGEFSGSDSYNYTNETADLD